MTDHYIENLSVNIDGKLNSVLKEFLLTQLPAIIDKYFEKYDDASDIEIDEINFDLGNISSQNFEEEFKIRVSYLLDQELAKLYKNKPQLADLRINRQLFGVDVLIEFLKTGVLYQKDKSLKAFFEELLQSNYDLLVQELRTLSQNNIAIERFVRQVDQTLIVSFGKQFIGAQNWQELEQIKSTVFNEFSGDLKNKVNIELSILLIQFLFKFDRERNVSVQFYNFLIVNRANFFLLIEESKSSEENTYFLEKLRAKISSRQTKENTIEGKIVLDYWQEGRVQFNNYYNTVKEIKSLGKDQLLSVVGELKIRKSNVFEIISRISKSVNTNEYLVVLEKIIINQGGELAKIYSEAKSMIQSFVDDKLVRTRKQQQSILLDYLKLYQQPSLSRKSVVDKIVNEVASYNAESKKSVLEKLGQGRISRDNLEGADELLSAFGELGQKIEIQLTELSLFRAYVHYLEFGVWLKKEVSVLDAFGELLKNNIVSLTNYLRQRIELKYIWIRLINQNSFDEVQLLFESVFAKEESFKVFQGWIYSFSVGVNKSRLKLLFEIFIDFKNSGSVAVEEFFRNELIEILSTETSEEINIESLFNALQEGKTVSVSFEFKNIDHLLFDLGTSEMNLSNLFSSFRNKEVFYHLVELTNEIITSIDIEKLQILLSIYQSFDEFGSFGVEEFFKERLAQYLELKKTAKLSVHDLLDKFQNKTQSVQFKSTLDIPKVKDALVLRKRSKDELAKALQSDLNMFVFVRASVEQGILSEREFVQILSSLNKKELVELIHEVVTKSWIIEEELLKLSSEALSLVLYKGVKHRFFNAFVKDLKKKEIPSLSSLAVIKKENSEVKVFKKELSKELQQVFPETVIEDLLIENWIERFIK